MFFNHKTSNPAFSPYFWDKKASVTNKMTISGIFLKSFFCICILSTLIAFVWYWFYEGNSIKWFASGGMLAAIIISLVISVKHHWVPFLVPLYAIAKGVFLGAFSIQVHQQYPNYPFQAVGITIIAFLMMIILYKTKLIILTKQLKSSIIIATTTIFTVYIVTWILSLFGINVSFIWGDNWFALAFNVFAVLTASFLLLLDIDFIDRKRNKAPKSSEWLATWGLLVTLIWLYIEVLRLMRRLAIRN